jgi:hypothetical protein
MKGTTMHVQRLIPLVVAGTLAAGPLFLPGQSVSASTRGGLVHVYDVNPGTTGTGSIVITGGIADSGTDQAGVSADADRIVLSKGTFEVNNSAIQKKFSTVKAKGNPANCGVVLAVTAPATLFNGTGAYKGIAGTVTLTITNAAVLPTKSNGKCDESPNSVALGEVTISQGSGTVSFG